MRCGGVTGAQAVTQCLVRNIKRVSLVKVRVYRTLKVKSGVLLVSTKVEAVGLNYPLKALIQLTLT